MSVAVNIRDQLRRLAQTSGERPAVVFGDETLTYAELESQSLRFATALDAAGIAPGARVAALLPNGVEWLVAYLGTAASGRIFVGLNTWFTGKDLAYVLGQCGAELLVMTGRFRSHNYDAALREALGGDAVSGGQVTSAALPALRGIIAVGATAAATSTWAEFLASGHRGEPRHQAAPADPALIVFTSGSTGLPKGVPLLQEALLRNGEYIGDRQHVTADDRLWLSTPLFFSYGCANAVMVVLSHGCTLLLQDFFDPRAAAELLEAEAATVYYATTNMTYALREELAARPRHLALRTGTAIGTPAQIRAAADLVPGICNIYGMTETYGNCTVTDADDPLEVRLATQGRPLPGHVITIVDTETERELPPGELGEIRVAGLVTPEYWNDPERTAASFDRQGRLRTGDLGCLDASGRLVWESRLGDLIKTAGVNVSAAEVERVLEQDSRILQVYVVGVPDEVRGENIAACVQPADDLLTAQDVVEFAQARLASYKVPRVVELRPSGEFPLTSTGKVSRRDLAKELARATA
jgi:fatty-acyl-CoA synthase